MRELALLALLVLFAFALDACIKLPGGPAGPVGWTLDANQRKQMSD